MSHSPVETQPFGRTPQGKTVDRYILTNRAGCRAALTNYGAMLTELHVPDRNGELADIVLGFHHLEDYLKGHPYFGTTTGPVANRIAGASFELNGKTFPLAANDGSNHLHGGKEALDKKVWLGQVLADLDQPAVEFSYLSPDGEEGYPGDVQIKVRYTLSESNALRIDYEACANQDTPINLTNHSYFNLADGGKTSILDHELELNADSFTPVDSQAIPTGEISPVKETVMDFRHKEKLGARIDQDMLAGDPGGYDHNYALNKTAPGALDLAARVTEPTSGRVMEVWTTEPGIQLYTGNFLDGSLTGKGGAVYQKRHGFCLEAQHFPDAPHHENFPSIILPAGKVYRQTTEHRFSTVN